MTDPTPDNTKPPSPSLESMERTGIPASPSIEMRQHLGDDAFEELQSLLVIPFFDELDRQNLKGLYQHFFREEYKAGEIIQHEGAASGLAMSGQESQSKAKTQRFHVIVSGQVRMSARSSQKDREIELNVLTKGRWFGDLGLVPKKSASLMAPDASSALNIQPVTVRAVEDTVLLTIDSKKFGEFVKEHPKTAVAIQAAASMPPLKMQLRKLPFFAHVSEFKLQQLGTLFEFRKVDTGDAICNQGDPGTGFFIIVKGRVSISVHGPDGNDVTLNTLQGGDWFGEIALLQETTRTATVRAIKPCTLLFLSREKFNTFLRLAPEIRHSGVFDKAIAQRTANSLKSVPMFSFLSKKQEAGGEDKLAILGELFKFVEFDAGATVFREGDEGDAFYIILSGNAIVTALVDKEDPESEEMVLTTLSDTDWFGEIALVNNTSRTASVRCETKCNMLKLLKKDFERFVALAPEIKETLTLMIRHRTAKSLKHVPFFQEVIEQEDASKLTMLGEMFVFEEAKSGTVLFEQGEEGDKFYIIVSGTVRMTRYKLVDESEGSEVEERVVGSPIMRGTTPEPDANPSSGMEHGVSTISISLAGAAGMGDDDDDDDDEDMGRPEPIPESASKFSLIVTDVDEPDEPEEAAAEEEKGPLVEPTLIKGNVVLRDFKDNEYFGEISLMKDISRTATATCTTDCLFVSITKSQFRSFLSIAPDIRDHFHSVINERTAEILQQFDLFSEFKDASIQEVMNPIAKLTDWEQADTDDVLCTYGEFGEKLFFVVSGAVRVTVPVEVAKEFEAAAASAPDADVMSDVSGTSTNAPQDPEMDMAYVTTLRQNSYFGEVALLKNCPRTATVCALTPCVLLVLPRENLNRLFELAPTVKDKMEDRVAGKYQFIKDKYKKRSS